MCFLCVYWRKPEDRTAQGLRSSDLPGRRPAATCDPAAVTVRSLQQGPYASTPAMTTEVHLWHFILNDGDGTWTWRQVSASGELIAESPFSFRSYNVCVADAQRAGYVRDQEPVRRIPVSNYMPQADGQLRRNSRDRQPSASPGPHRTRQQR